MKPNKILLINDSGDCGASYGTPFHDFGEVTHDLNLIETSPGQLIAAVFTGGADVDPSMYDQQKLSGTHSNLPRDYQERQYFYKLQAYGIPLFGICRGAQFLGVMAGGTMIQHMSHPGNHNIQELETKRIISVNSLHHQMVVPPWGDDAVVIAVAHPTPLSAVHEYAGPQPLKEPIQECEVVYYPNIKALGAQYHPEIMSKDSDGWKYYQELVAKYIKK